MAGKGSAVSRFFSTHVKDESGRAATLRLLRAVGLFAGAIWVMRNYGESMEI